MKVSQSVSAKSQCSAELPIAQSGNSYLHFMRVKPLKKQTSCSDADNCKWAYIIAAGEPINVCMAYGTATY